MLYTTMIMTFTVGVDLGFVLGCFLLIFYHIASMNRNSPKDTGFVPSLACPVLEQIKPDNP